MRIHTPTEAYISHSRYIDPLLLIHSLEFVDPNDFIGVDKLNMENLSMIFERSSIFTASDRAVNTICGMMDTLPARVEDPMEPMEC